MTKRGMRRTGDKEGDEKGGQKTKKGMRRTRDKERDEKDREQ